jgi:hypothetical protein
MYMKLMDVHRWSLTRTADAAATRGAAEADEYPWDSVSDVISVRHATTTTMFNPSFQTMVVEVSRHPWSTTEFRVDYRVYRQQRNRRDSKCCLLYR